MKSRSPHRRRQLVLTGWLILTGVTIAIMLAFSMWFRLNHHFQPARDWLGLAGFVMIISVYVSDTIRGLRGPQDTERCCTCCARERREGIRLPPPPKPGDPPNLTKV